MDEVTQDWAEGLGRALRSPSISVQAEESPQGDRGGVAAAI